MAVEINEREQTLLKALIESYVRDGQPVGSRKLAGDSRLKLSSATIRNVMADLEEQGLVGSSHHEGLPQHDVDKGSILLDLEAVDHANFKHICGSMIQEDGSVHVQAHDALRIPGGQIGIPIPCSARIVMGDLDRFLATGRQKEETENEEDWMDE